MNRIVYILVFQMLLLFGCKENKVCNISADIEGLSGGRAEHTVQYYSSLCGELESFTCKGDKFEITKEFDEPAVLTFYFENDTLNRVVLPFNQSICLIVIAQPGEDITINGKVTDYVQAYPSGDYENNTLSVLLKKIYPLAAEATNSAYDFCRNSSNMTKDEIKAINSKFLALKKQITEEKKKFVNEHYSSVAGLWVMKELFQKEAISVEDAERLLDKADSKYHDIRFYKELKTRIEGTKGCAEGSVLKLQTSNTIDGKSFDIKSLRGKYVIIDFWGTWCGACCAGMPHLKEFRDKYSDKLQVVAVNCGDKKEQWLNSKFTKEYDFVHIKSNKGKNDLSKRFNLSAYPTKILLSPEGKVLKKYVGEYPDLYQEIEDMMKK